MMSQTQNNEECSKLAEFFLPGDIKKIGRIAWNAFKDKELPGFPPWINLSKIAQVFSFNNGKNASFDLEMYLDFLCKVKAADIDLSRCLRTYETSRKQLQSEDFLEYLDAFMLDDHKKTYKEYILYLMNNYNDTNLNMYNYYDRKSTAANVSGTNFIKNQKKFDISQLPKPEYDHEIERKDILGQIDECFNQNSICFVTPKTPDDDKNIGGGYGKSYLADRYAWIARSQCRYDAIYAYSFNNQGQNDDVRRDGSWLQPIIKELSKRLNIDVKESEYFTVMDVLVEMLSKKTILLILDGVEAEGLGKNSQLIEFLKRVKDKELSSKILLTSRVNIDRFVSVSIPKLTKDQVGNFIQDTLDDPLTLGDDSDSILQIPLFLAFFVKKYKENKEFKKIINLEANKVSEYFKIIFSNLTEEEKSFMYILSSMPRELSDEEYRIIKELLKERISTLDNPKENDLKKLFVSFDKRDRGKFWVKEGTYETHALIKNYFKVLMHSSEEEGIINKAIANMYLIQYRTVKDSSPHVAKDSVVRAIDFFIRAKEMNMALEVLFARVNGQKPIRSYGMHQDVYNAMHDMYHKANDLLKYLLVGKAMFDFISLYRFLALTTGDTKQAFTFSQSIMKFLLSHIEESFESEEERCIKMLDWLVMSLEAYKYYGQKIDDIVNFKKGNEKVCSTETNEIKLMKNLFDKRVEEIETMYSGDLSSINIKLSDEKEIKLINEVIKNERIESLKKIIKEKTVNELQKEIINSCNDSIDQKAIDYAVHPHIIWVERRISLWIDMIVNQVIEELANPDNIDSIMKKYTDNLVKIETILIKRITLFIYAGRDAYIILAGIVLMKYYCLMSLKNSSTENKEFYIKIRELTEVVTKKQQKRDFSIEYILVKTLCDNMMEIEDGDTDLKKISYELKQSGIEFLNLEYLLLKMLIDDEAIEKDKEKRIKERWKYLIPRLEAITKYKESRDSRSPEQMIKSNVPNGTS